MSYGIRMVVDTTPVPLEFPTQLNLTANCQDDRQGAS